MDLVVKHRRTGVGETVAVDQLPAGKIIGLEGKAGADEEDVALVLDHIAQPGPALEEQILLPLKRQPILRRRVEANANIGVIGRNQVPEAVEEDHAAVVNRANI